MAAPLPHELLSFREAYEQLLAAHEREMQELRRQQPGPPAPSNGFDMPQPPVDPEPCLPALPGQARDDTSNKLVTSLVSDHQSRNKLVDPTMSDHQTGGHKDNDSSRFPSRCSSPRARTHRLPELRISGDAHAEEIFARDQAKDALMATRSNRLAYRIVKSWYFDTISLCVILLNSLFIGASITFDLECAMYGCTDSAVWGYVETAFIVIFTIELIVRLCAEDILMFMLGDWFWNVLDVLLVLSSWVAVIIQYPNLSVTRGIRLFRIPRVLRIIRVVRVCASLRIMVYAILLTLHALVWVLLVLVLFMYMASMICMHAAADQYLQGGGSPEHLDELKLFFGSIPISILTLFQCISGGRDWAEVYMALDECGAVYGLFFSGFIYFMTFSVLNVVIGTVVDVTSAVAKRDKDRVVSEHITNVKQYAADTTNFFRMTDKDKSGELSWEEFSKCLQDDRVKAYFQSLDMSVTQARTLFELLDRNDNGQVGISEFFDGCVRLRGEARSLDVNLALTLLENLSEAVDGICKRMDCPVPSSWQLRHLEA